MDVNPTTAVIAISLGLGVFLAFAPIARWISSGALPTAKALEIAQKAERDARAEAERVRVAMEEMDARLNNQRAMLDEADRRIARLRQALQDAETYVVECIQTMQRAGVTPPSRHYANDPPSRQRAHSMAEFIAEYFTDDDITVMFAEFRVPEYDAPQASTLIRAHRLTNATRGAATRLREYVLEKRPNLAEELKEIV